ncbi:MAG: hypothetical protein M1817_004590 [Caeruleum heppii]|nr:MAG: hypothetical protein M1817_004590 [Caeruleum heppii]
MVDLQDAKVIRRDELCSSEDASTSDGGAEALNELLQQRLGERLLMTETRWAADTDDTLSKPTEESELEAFDFRLFSKPLRHSRSHDQEPSTWQPTSKIRIQSPQILENAPSFVEHQRPKGFYFTTGPSWAQKQEIAAAALTGEQIMALSGRKCPGLQLPWRSGVIKVAPSVSHSCAIPNAVSHRARATGRKRPGKKRRIATRVKVKTKLEQQQQALEEAAKRGAAEREKRTRRNREKKVKRKERDAEKKRIVDHDSANMP